MAALLVGVMALVLAHTSSSSAGAGSSATVSGKAGSVMISNFKFAPQTVTVKVGTRVTWTNQDTAEHTATADQGSFDTGTLAKSQSKTIALSKPGTFTYHCVFHAFMTATIKVVS